MTTPTRNFPSADKGRSDASRVGFWAFIVLMLGLALTFIMLGTWQIERLADKERLIASVAGSMDLPPKELPDPSEWAGLDVETWNYRPVQLSGTWLPAQTVRVFTSLSDQNGQYGGPGYWIMTPLQLVTGGTVFVNRGFVPEESSDAFVTGGTIEAGLVSVEGVGRVSEEVGSFTPKPDASKRIEWVRNTQRLAAIAGPVPQPVAPIYVDLPAMGQGALPQGGETVVSFPNNHLGYAITWYGFAVIVPFLLFFWILRQRQERA